MTYVLIFKLFLHYVINGRTDGWTITSVIFTSLLELAVLYLR